MVIKTNRSDKTEIKKFLKISGHQQRWPRPLPGAILIPPALLVVADFITNIAPGFHEVSYKRRLWPEKFTRLVWRAASLIENETPA